MIVDPPQKLDNEELSILSSYFGISIEKKSNDDISRMVLTHILKRWEESKTQLYRRSSAMTPS